MASRRSPVLLTALLCLSCRDSGKAPSTDTGDPELTWDTSTWVDSGDSSTPADSGDTASLFTTLTLYPQEIVVEPGSSWNLRLVGTLEDGSTSDVDGEIWADDTSILNLEGMIATVNSEPDTDTVVTLTAHSEGTLTQATVLVRTDDLIDVEVIDAQTGSPIPTATIVVDEGDRNDVDEDGKSRFSIEADGQPLDVSAFAEGYVPLTILQTSSRRLTMALNSDEVTDDDEATYTGAVSFDTVTDPKWDELAIGLVAPSLPSAPLLFEPRHLVAEDRSVTLFGIEANLPSNLVIEGTEESYELQVPSGQTPVWTLAGPIPVDDLTAGFSDTSSALALLQQHSDRLWWGWDPGVELDAMELGEVGVTPELSLDEQILVHVGELSTGFSGEEQVLVLLGELYDQHGWVVSGFGVGNTSVTVDRVEDSTVGSTEQEVVAVAQVGGLGEGGGLCLGRADVNGSEITTPSLMEVSQVVSFDGSTREFEISTDERAHIVRARIYGGSESVREILHAGGTLTGILPAPGFTFGHGQTDWTLIAYETQNGTFESLATQGSNTNEDLAHRSQAISRIHSEF